MTNTQNNLVEKAGEVLIPLYNLQPMVIERGEGCYLYDTEGKQYLDFAAGIAVSCLGHNNPAFNKIVTDQLSKVTMLGAAYVTKPRVDLAEYLAEHTCFDQMYICNSGTEAIEAAIKFVRKWAHETKGPDAYEFIVFDHAFHGRTMGAASLTYKRENQPFFGPYLPGIKQAKFNDIDSVKALIGNNTAAVFIEPVQGEGGVLPAEKDFMKKLRALCDEHNVALVFDEIQCGMGRLGYFNAYEHFGVEPDLAAWAKGIGNGFPLGALGAKKKFSSVMKIGDHGTTYGGNPLACAVGAGVCAIINQPEFLKNVQETGSYFKSRLEELKRETNSIVAIRGEGLMIGIDTVYDIKKLMKSCIEHGLLATIAGEKTLRLTPPLIVTKAHIDEAIEKLGNVIRKGDLS